MAVVYRIYVEKKPDFAVEAAGVLADVRTVLGLEGVTGVRLLNRYDVQHLDETWLARAKTTIFSEPQVDVLYDDIPEISGEHRVFAVQYLPGQFDQRADSCAQCIQIMTQGERPLVRTARVYCILGSVTDEELARIKGLLINPVESREASLEPERTLEAVYEVPTSVETLTGFTAYDETRLAAFVKQYGLAMDLDDIRFLQAYFRDEEHRDPTITEIRMVDTYWSDHCRHTTFSTHLDSVTIEPPYIQKTYERYLALREKLYAGKDKPITLMDLAVIGAKALRAEGYLKDLDESEEINACSVRIDVDVDGKTEPWLLMFKNETHNHPTEIEPFGGAATCLGGAIRDPLSGRSYVYQAMRVTGAADPTLPVSQTMRGKLPQRRLTTTAAAGYSSYGNQIGLATGQVNELYHPGYAAKRMELGAVIGAAPAGNVRRECPAPGDVVILLGGKTGRDGCGGATGSSKQHTLDSLETCGAEVQKGNAPEERKIQRLFRNPEVTRLIKRCNDFGAGGVSVAIGELADGLRINLDLVPKKYEGLDGTELAISESQERMAVVVAKQDAARFIELSATENLDAVEVAVVTEQPRLVMSWNGATIVDVSRAFLNTNGAVKHAGVRIASMGRPAAPSAKQPGAARRFVELVSNLNVASQKGLVSRFDSTIGSGNVLMPLGGKRQLTPTQAMVCKLPVLTGETTTCSVMAWGFDPFYSEQNPYLGAMAAVTQSVARVVAAGGDWHKCWLSFQEYFGRTGADPERWGKPFSALLGALEAQLELHCGAIGGKDSMSGTFEALDVPPTLVSFAVSTARLDTVISPELKHAGSRLYHLYAEDGADGLPNFESIRRTLDTVQELIRAGKALSVWCCGATGPAEGLFKMSLGNAIGFDVSGCEVDAIFAPRHAAFLIEADGALDCGTLLGTTTSDFMARLPDGALDLNELQKLWEQKLEGVFPTRTQAEERAVPAYSFTAKSHKKPAVSVARPRVLIPVFPGTNCEYDTARAFERAGAEAEVFIVRNRTAAEMEQSVAAFAEAIARSQIITLPGGFSGGDEPDGSAKFITAFFRNPRITEETHALLKNRDGLMLGICNGFQALVKLGLVPYGEIRDAEPDGPTLTYNTIGRHQSLLVHTRVASNLSPWFMHLTPGDVHVTAVSHGEGRFVATPALVAQLAANGQIASQYADLSGAPGMDISCNPNGSVDAIEGITSPDGRVLGKMAHSERFTTGIYKNVPGEKENGMFRSAVAYYK